MEGFSKFLDIHSLVPQSIVLDHHLSFPDIPNSAIEHARRFTKETDGSTMIRYRYDTKVNLNALSYRKSLEVIHEIGLSLNTSRGSAFDYILEITTSFTLYDSLVKEVAFHFDANQNYQHSVKVPFQFG